MLKHRCPDGRPFQQGFRSASNNRICGEQGHDEQWRTLIGAALELPFAEANRILFSMLVFSRLRTVNPEIVRELETMIELDVENDPFCVPMVDRIAAAHTISLIVQLTERRGLEMAQNQVDALNEAGEKAASALLLDMASSDNPQECLDSFALPDFEVLRPGGDD